MPRISRICRPFRTSRLLATLVPLAQCLRALCLLAPVGALAQDVKPLDLAGLRALLEQHKGRVVMLNFFATWCPPCRAEIGEISRIYADYEKKGVTLIGLSVDDDKTLVPPFVAKQGIAWPVYTVGQDVAATYRIMSIPHNAIYGKDGKLVLSEAGVADASGMRTVFDELLARE